MELRKEHPDGAVTAELGQRLARWRLNRNYNPSGAWTSSHQMSLAGKRDDFEMADLRAVARSASMKRGRADAIVAEVLEVVRQWPSFADQAGVPESTADAIRRAHRLGLS